MFVTIAGSRQDHPAPYQHGQGHERSDAVVAQQVRDVPGRAPGDTTTPFRRLRSYLVTYLRGPQLREADHDAGLRESEGPLWFGKRTPPKWVRGREECHGERPR